MSNIPNVVVMEVLGGIWKIAGDFIIGGVRWGSPCGDKGLEIPHIPENSDIKFVMEDSGWGGVPVGGAGRPNKISTEVISQICKNSQ